MVRSVTRKLLPVRPFPALLLQKQSKRILVIADLHLGWEVTLAERGIHVPSQTQKILDKMIRLIESCKPTNLIFLGDVKHSVTGIRMGEWRDIPDFFETLGKMVPDIQIVPGNHDGNLDPLLPEFVKILPSTGIVLWDIGLFHGHAWPAPELLGCRHLITGHVHPMVVFRDPAGFRITRPVWVKTECDGTKLAKSVLKHAKVKVEENLAALLQKLFNVKLKCSQLFIMPSFNDFLGGQPVNRKSLGKNRRSRAFIGPVLRSGSVDIDNAEICLLDGTFLGKISQLRAFS
ncbi:MAG: metallophosphoesterase [Candidatus Bathyarchaeota archaeon]|nr:MAG: metallophosphoesterase [Candidatus Bathyarchaeota archaeon]